MLLPVADKVRSRPPRRATPRHSSAARGEISLRLADRRGSTAVEFAIISPILILLLFGIIVYGGYFMLSHSLQQMADDAARASIAGLTDAERSSLAQAAVTNDVQTYSYLQPSLLQVNFTDQNQVLTITLTYNASRSPFWALSGLVPMPSSTLVSSAAIQIGGY
jgi:Flp pilus assembly protein TadG